MKHPLRSTLCIAAGLAILAALAAMLFCCIRHYKRAEQLSLYPAEQVEAALQQAILFEEANSLLASSKSDEEKIAALAALSTRMRALRAPLGTMSGHRAQQIQEVLGYDQEELNALASALFFGVQPEESEQKLALSAATHEFLRAWRDSARDATPEQTATALLCHVEEMQAALQREELSPWERLEALRLHFERLLDLSLPLYMGEDKGHAHRRALEEHMRRHPQELARLEAHLALMKPRHAVEVEVEEGDSTSMQRQYYDFLSDTLCLSLWELTAEGRQLLDGVASFLSGADASSSLLFGDVSTGLSCRMGDEASARYTHRIRLVPAETALSFTMAGGDAASEAIDEHFSGGCLLCVPTTAVNWQEEKLEGELHLEQFLKVRGGQETLERVLHLHPELRGRVEAGNISPQS